MNHKLRYLLVFTLIGLVGPVKAQEILGTVTDEKKEPLVSASVVVKQGGITKGGAITDFDGNYSIKPLEAGTYDVTISFAGFAPKTFTGVIVTPNDKTGVNAVLTRSDKTVLKEVTVSWKKPLVDPYKQSNVVTREEIKHKPTTQTADIVAQQPGMYQAQRGGGINADGGRSTGNTYIIDGVVVQGTLGIDMSQGSIEQLEVISSGISARYGDVSGAVVNITTRGVASKYNGSVRLQKSVDGYNNNLASFSMAGPLLKKKADSTHEAKPIMGFSLSGDYYEDHNRYPQYLKEYVAKDEVMQELLKNPLKITTDNSGQTIYNLASQYVTKDQLRTVKTPPNNVTRELRLNGKVDYKLNDNMTLAASGMFNYMKDDGYSRGRNLFASAATPVTYTYTSRGSLRFTQRFGKPNYGGTTENSKPSIISNAYYTVQMDFQNTLQKSEDPKFGQNIFEYGYVGKFNKQFTDIYLPNQADSASGRRGTVLFVKAPTAITYERDPLNRNPYLANYTSQYYNNLGDNLPRTMTQIQSNNAMTNGDQPLYTYGLFLSPGTTITGYSKYNTSQYALTVDAAFDLNAGGIKHGIEFGLYYQQRIIRSYSLSSNISGAGTASLWQQMRQLVSSIDNGKLALDKTNPIFRVNGKDYTLGDVNNGTVIPGVNDTIYYNYANASQTAFDINLRKKLGLGKTDNINIDGLDPSKFSVDLFSADELLNSGNPFVSYYGYSYTGAVENNVSFNDFWTKKDANGNYTRPIGAFSPNLIAGYILDKFKYKDIVCNIGVRVERYSANTKVLKDPYSLYETRTVATTGSEATNYLNGSKTPTNIGSDYVVYVDDNSSSNKSIVGYRNGATWYDATGKLIDDPSILRDYTGGRDPQPLLVNDTVKITSNNFNPNGSFTDYNPQVTVMPRIQISFPINQSSKFFAHYDIYVQRPYPTGLGIATAYDYYYLNQNSNSIISNANLRSQKTFDYELGFEQLLGRDAVLKLNGFYKERKDMITVQPYLFAWPTTYYTYGNRDFSSTKGVKLFFETRAAKNLNLSVAYTLQYAEGTGSDYASSNGGSGGSISPQGLLQSFIEAGLPNLRYVAPLSYDSRHNIVASIDYRLPDKEGPVVFGKHIFENAGINLVTRMRSGEPFTRRVTPNGSAIAGGINGSRLPWHFGMDLRVDKEFAFKISEKKVQKLAAFCLINNLLNTREIMGVYGYTGKPDDNGFLASPFGTPSILAAANARSYTDLYNIANNGVGNFNFARTINLGIEFNF